MPLWISLEAGHSLTLGLMLALIGCRVYIWILEKNELNSHENYACQKAIYLKLCGNCAIYPSGWSKADSSSKTYISIHSMCRDVDLLYWLLITQCQSQADGERNWFLFFPPVFALTQAVDHYISLPLTMGMMSRCCAFPLLFPPLSLSLRPSPSSTSPAVSFLLCNPFIHFFRCQSNWQCSENSYRAMSCEKPNDTERRITEGYHSTAVVGVWTADNTQIR